MNWLFIINWINRNKLFFVLTSPLSTFCVLKGFVILTRMEKTRTWCVHFPQCGTAESFIRLAWTHSLVMWEAYKVFIVLLKYWLTWEVKRRAWVCFLVSDMFWCFKIFLFRKMNNFGQFPVLVGIRGVTTRVGSFNFFIQKLFTFWYK